MYASCLGMGFGSRLSKWHPSFCIWYQNGVRGPRQKFRLLLPLLSSDPTPATPACFQALTLHSRTSQISSLFNLVFDLPLPLAPTWISAEGDGQGQLNQGWQVGWEKGDEVQGRRRWEGPEEPLQNTQRRAGSWGEDPQNLSRGDDVNQNMWLQNDTAAAVYVIEPVSFDIFLKAMAFLLKQSCQRTDPDS